MKKETGGKEIKFNWWVMSFVRQNINIHFSCTMFTPVTFVKKFETIKIVLEITVFAVLMRIMLHMDG